VARRDLHTLRIAKNLNLNKESIMTSKRITINKISVQGFKSIIDKQEIEIRPLTLLAGANSSGKSSIMQPLLLLKQTIEAPGDPGALLLDGPNVRFTQSEQLLSHISGKTATNEFCVKMESSSEKKLEVVFKREPGAGFDVASMSYANGNQSLTIAPGMGHDEIIKILPPFLSKIYADIQKREKEMKWFVYRERCFLAFGLRGLGPEAPEILFRPHGISPSEDFIPHLQNMIHLPGLRGNPRRTYPKSAAGPHFPGTFENYVASIISQWQATGDERLSQLSLSLEEMGLTWKVKAEPIDDTQVELKVGRLVHSRRGGAHDLVSIADVGFGVSQSLPVVVALTVAKQGQLVYLEQPEIHLHPRAQRKLAHILKNASQRRGITVIAETHSSLLLKEIQTLVAKGELSSDIVKLHWVQRLDDGRTIVTSADLDKNGAYGTWPEDFDETELDAEKSYLDAVESKGAQ
jgi:predicted ATPase